ncbi:MAG TPA: arsenosugar biosynthesis radical SAM (seleno)protein ArsS [Candidatus Limnocylindrales bacterium]|nr:arsenosugar biosynthesis radical SAM (seleno)protein ArsS [Candidatus Limnocylindrales bacterium]
MSVPAERAGSAAVAGARGFLTVLRDHDLDAPVRQRCTTLQINVGKICNQACHHCHVEAGPKRTETMTAATAERVLELLAASRDVALLDITGGAPELNEFFATIVERARALGRRVCVRSNLTVLFEPGMAWLPEFYRRNGVELVCSLPCYTGANVDRQRGRGVFDRSIEALRLLCSLGYGQPDSGLDLDLVYNPLGAFLPPAQAELEQKYREELARLYGIRFRRLLTITNMPIKRFAEMLERTGEYERYMSLLVQHFNPATVGALMCRDMISVGYDGSIYDCDFNQMLEMPLVRQGAAQTLWTIDNIDDLAGTAIATASHCFGCTAGAGSSCQGALS